MTPPPASLELDVLPDRARGMLYIAPDRSAPLKTGVAFIAGAISVAVAVMNEGNSWMLLGYSGAFVFLGLAGLSVRNLFRLPQNFELAPTHVEIGHDRWLRSQVRRVIATQTDVKQPILLVLEAADATETWTLNPYQHSLGEIQWLAGQLEGDGYGLESDTD